MKISEPLSIYEGRVWHRRYFPKSHEFTYRVFSFLIDVARLDEAARKYRFFSRNRFNLFSFFDRDHGSGNPEDVNVHVRGVLKEAGFPVGGRIMLLCYPRMLGYAFNPLSVYFCYDKDEVLSVVIYEVRNTFGARHAYLIPVIGGRKQGVVSQAADKKLHVSPFNDMDMTYSFHLRPPGERTSVLIRTKQNDRPLLDASFEGALAPGASGSLGALFLRYPLMTLKVIMAIHWEAVRLIAKGMRLNPDAGAPETAVTVVRNTPDEIAT